MKEADKIIEVITGNVAEGDKKTVLNSVKQDSQLRKEYIDIKNAWALSSSQIGMSELKIERSYLSLKSKISGQKQTVTVRMYSLLKYAAVLLIVFGAGIFSNKVMEPKIAKNERTEIVVPQGQIAEVNLPDGSHAWLNAETSLSFTNNFTEKMREVVLKGEAYFEVQEGEEPFVVSTKYGEITVLGTSFNVSAFGNSEFQATLMEGSIKYSNTELGEEITLSPGQQVVLTENEGIQVREVSTNIYIAWISGAIVFENEPLRTVLQKLERHFAVKIELVDSQLGDIRFTGKIENESLFEVMEYINKTKAIAYTYDKKQKVLTVKLK